MLKFTRPELKYLEMLLELNIKTILLSTLDERNMPVLNQYQEAELKLNADLLYKVKNEFSKSKVSA